MRQENFKFEANLGCIARPCLKKNKTKIQLQNNIKNTHAPACNMQRKFLIFGMGEEFLRLKLLNSVCTCVFLIKNNAMK
jgi:hypothetical protein